MTLIELISDNLRALTVAGLICDIFGALLVLGPELPLVAWWATRYERDRLRDFIDRLEAGEVLDEGEKDFEHLREVIVQNLKIDRYLFDFDKVEAINGAVELYDAAGADKRRFQMADLKEWSKEYEGIKRRYSQLGAWLLFTGFSLQLIAEVSAVNLFVGVALLLILSGFIGGGLISWKYL